MTDLVLFKAYLDVIVQIIVCVSLASSRLLTDIVVGRYFSVALQSLHCAYEQPFEEAGQASSRFTDEDAKELTCPRTLK